jgi:hypothetical protein
MIGYKGFNADMTCLDFQYELGQTYRIPPDETKLCIRGFHFCRFPCDVFEYYNQNSLYAMIRAEDLIIEDNNKCVTNQITILESLTKDQLLQLMPNKITRKNGTIEYYKNGLLHRENGPAIIYADGRKKWYQNGHLHRLDGPASEWPKFYREWYQTGLLHRTDGPAIEYYNSRTRNYKNGEKVFYRNGVLCGRESRIYRIY